MKLTVLTAAACLSPGDALRFVDQKDLMKNDFVFVTGDVVASFDLQTALASHKQRQAADRHAIMTMVRIGSYNCFTECHGKRSSGVVMHTKTAGLNCMLDYAHCILGQATEV